VDDATIEAMRKVIDINDQSIAYHEGYGDKELKMISGRLPIDEFRLANDGFRELVDKAAAEQSMEPSRHPVADALLKAMSYAPHDRFVEVGRCSQFGDRTVIGQFTKGEVACFLESIKQPLASERDAEPVAASEDEALTRFVDMLEDMWLAADKFDAPKMTLVTRSYAREWSTVDILLVVRAINGLLNARPTTPATPAEPTLEECVAAINGAKHRDSRGWVIKAKHTDSDSAFELDIDELRGLGRLLIDRERAAKGGA
jgi:hypothetical protein